MNHEEKVIERGITRARCQIAAAAGGSAGQPGFRRARLGRVVDTLG